MTARHGETSAVARVFEQLRTLNAGWNVEIGRPLPDTGWIVGAQLADARSGPLNHLLLSIGDRLATNDRRTIAALFAMRFGWAAAMAIAPFVKLSCVPDVALEHVSLKFKTSTFFERTAIHVPGGVFLEGEVPDHESSVRTVPDRASLLQCLRQVLIAQAQPVVETLQDWSGFAPRGTWGMLTSSWASHLITLSAAGSDQSGVLPLLQRFFEGQDLAAAMQPRVHLVSYRHASHVYQRRASCCRFYLVPSGELCASCPLVSHEERVTRNRAWMRRQLDGPFEPRGHR